MSRSTSYETYYKVGALNGKNVYSHPQFGLAIERDRRLVAMTPKELMAWYSQEQDEKKLAELEEARRDAEEWLSEIGHGYAYNWPHLPEVI